MPGPDLELTIPLQRVGDRQLARNRVVTGDDHSAGCRESRVQAANSTETRVGFAWGCP